MAPCPPASGSSGSDKTSVRIEMTCLALKRRRGNVVVKGSSFLWRAWNGSDRFRRERCAR